MRLFIAIDLPVDVKEQLYLLSKKILGIKAKFVEKENYHITLKFIGEYEKPNKIIDALKDIEFTSFEINLKDIGMFNKRVIWVGITKGQDKIIELHNIINKKLNEKLNFPFDIRFHPHITIARIKYILNRILLENSIKNLKFEIKNIKIKEFKLKKSTLTPSGPIYETLYSFKLK